MRCAVPVNIIAPSGSSSTTPFGFTSGPPQRVQISIGAVNGDFVVVKYRGLAGNRPKTYGNFVAIWDATVIPWAEKPLAVQTIPRDRAMSAAVISGLTITDDSYIIGYGVGRDMTSICATALVNPEPAMSAGAPMFVDIAIAAVDANNVTLTYGTLEGYLPRTYGNTVTLYPGYASPYNPPPPLKTVPVPSDATAGIVLIDGVEIGRGLPYTVVYATQGGPPPLAAAALVTFDTSPRAPPGA